MKMTLISDTSNCFIIFQEKENDSSNIIMEVIFDERIKFEAKFAGPKKELLDEFKNKNSFSISKANFKFIEEPVKNSNEIFESYNLLINNRRLGNFRYTDIIKFIDIFS